MIALRLLVVLLLVACNAFFAAVEFSLVALRPSRIRQLVEEGDARARVVQALVAEMGLVVSGVQVGVTLTSLSLGFLGEAAIAVAVERLFSVVATPERAFLIHGFSFALAFLSLTFLHVVLGELVPKTISLERSEQVALLVARPFSLFLSTFRGAIQILEGSAQRINRALGATSAHSHTLAHSAEELQILVEQAREQGLLEPGEEKFIQSALELGRIQVREIMVHRSDVHALPIDASLDDVLRMFAVTQRSRLPVYEGSLDHPAGFIHVKDILWVMLDRQRRKDEALPSPDFHLRGEIRPIVIVPETKAAAELLSELRSKHTGMAMVVDEFGTILGLVTLEDLLEQIVGEIHDEFDVVERPLTLPDGAMVVEGSLKMRDLEKQHAIELPEDASYETLGGFVMARLGFIPKGGESFEEAGFRSTVMEVDRRRVARVKIQRLRTASP
ncbi:MAG TPA: hemolysin family protein [Candidatus Acidoferrales bacterium]|nr:hemolysin family protein [Candidatus Acidoferrales bacterium]